MLAEPWTGWPACPCGCGEEGLKLQERHDKHLVGCKCLSCQGRRNRRKGPDTARKRHRRLGGTGLAISDDLHHAYSINISVEDKAGQQIPRNFLSFIELEWTRHALRQAEKKVPVGSDALPILVLDLGRKGMWMVGPLPERGLR